MTAHQHVEVVRRGAVATVIIRRPEIHNASNEHVIARVRTGDEGREGVRAFLEKRHPRGLAGVDV